MRTLVVPILFVLFSCNSEPGNKTVIPDPIIYQARDKEILEQIFESYSDEKEAATADLILKVGSFFLETPYVAHTLETGEEQLVINLREMDCTTFAEYCLALARTI